MSFSSRSSLSTPLVWLALFVWLACTAWWRPLAVPDEGRYAGVAWEMIRSGDWLTPTLNGLPFFHKPPLFYWLTAASLKVFGMDLGAARLASVLGAVLGAGALYLLVRRWGGERLALWATLALVTQPFWFGGAQYANLDMLVAGCISATIALAAHAVLSQEADRPHRLALCAAYAMAGLGLLAKGLIGVVLPGSVIVGWLLLTGRWRSLLQVVSIPGWLVLGLVAAPWFVAMQRLYPDFFHYFFVYQHFQRFTQTGFNNMHPFWYYVPLILVLGLPWTLTGLWARWWPQDRSLAFLHGRGQGPGRRALRSLAWVWLGVVLVFFSIPASKLPGYVLPALPPLALIVADLLARRWHGADARAFWGLTLAAAVLCVGLIGVAVRFDRQSVRPALPLVQPLLDQGVPLVFVDEFVYDLPFYLARHDPVPVVSDWSDPDLPLRDNDRKELFDAGEFNPELARRLLVPKAQWRATLCAQPRLVVLAPPKAAQRWPELAAQAPAMQLKLSSVWVLERSSLKARGLVCP